jgi:hypothetical protein
VADRHKHTPVRFRPPEADRTWLQDFAERTGRAVNAILTEALSQYRSRSDGESAEGKED